MALTTEQRLQARRLILGAVFTNGAPVTVTKDQVDEVALAACQWLEDNAASFVSAMQGTVAANQPAPTLAAVLVAVARARFGGR